MKLGTKIAITMSALVVCVLALLGIVDVSRDQEFFEADTTRDHVVLADLLAGSVREWRREWRREWNRNGECCREWFAAVLGRRSPSDARLC